MSNLDLGPQGRGRRNAEDEIGTVRPAEVDDLDGCRRGSGASQPLTQAYFFHFFSPLCQFRLQRMLNTSIGDASAFAELLEYRHIKWPGLAPIESKMCLLKWFVLRVVFPILLLVSKYTRSDGSFEFGVGSLR